MNLDNIYLLDHPQISTSGYRSNTSNTNSINQPIAPMKPPSLLNNGIANPATSLGLGDTDKVIFKIESDHLTSNNNLSNFKLNSTFSNHQIVNQSNNISNSNNTELKQFKIVNNVNVPPNSTNLSSNVLSVKQQQHFIKSEPKDENLPANLEPTLVEAQLDTFDPNALNIYVNNVVCSYSTRCHLNLRRIAMEGLHVEYKKENGMVNMKLRKPYTTATMWSSGKVTCAGAKSESDAYKAARRFCRMLQKMQFKVKLTNYRVVNVLATCNIPFGVDIQKLAENYQKECSYEPELHPGATFKLLKIKATLKLFTTGSITLTAPSVLIAKEAINQIYPILLEFKRTFPSDQHNMNNISNQVIAQKESDISTPIQQQNFFQSNSLNNSTIKIEPDYKPPTQSTFSNFCFYSNLLSNTKSITKTIGNPTVTSISSLNYNTNSIESSSNSYHQQNNITHINVCKNQQLQGSTFNQESNKVSLSQQPKSSTITSSNQIYQVNLPSTYHHIIPSNSLHSYTPVQEVSTSEANNQSFVSSITTNGTINNISSSLLNTIQTTSPHMHQPSIQQNAFSLNHTNNTININNNSSNISIISSNSFSNNLVSTSSTFNQPSNGWYYDSLLVDNVDDFLP